jgi:hypothetical protein
MKRRIQRSRTLHGPVMYYSNIHDVGTIRSPPSARFRYGCMHRCRALGIDRCSSRLIEPKTKLKFVHGWGKLAGDHLRPHLRQLNEPRKFVSEDGGIATPPDTLFYQIIR